MREFLSYYSNMNDNLNEDIIKNIRLRDFMPTYIEEICIELAKSLPEYVTYLGFDFDDSKNRFRELNVSKKKDSKTGKFENVPYINTNYTFSRLAVFHFKIKYKEPRTEKLTISKIDMPIYIPQFIDDYHYFIRGNKYSAPYQLTDAVTYNGKNNSVIFKTLTRAIKISRMPAIITDEHGLSYRTFAFYVHISKKKVSFLLYHFAYYGFFSTLKYFGADKFINIFEECPKDPDEDTIYFKFGKVFLGVDRNAFNSIFELRQFVCSILLLKRKKLSLEYIKNTYYWRMILGTTVSQTKSYDQGASLLITFITCLDSRTINNLKVLVGGSRKDTSFAVLRWMFINYSKLYNKSTSITNNRLRYGEYLVTPLVRDMQMKLYRFLKTRPNMRDLKRLLDIFKPSSSIITNAIIGKTKNKAQMLNIAKYADQVNDLALLHTALKFTRVGPGTQAEMIPVKRASLLIKQADPSYLGQIDPISASASSPGT